MKPKSTLAATARRKGPPTEPLWVQRLLIAVALTSLSVLVVIPVINVFQQAFAGGVSRYFESLFGNPETRHAILLTLFVAPIAVVMNFIFGLAAAWLLTRFQFPGRTFLTTLIDLPFAVSPVVAGLMIVLVFGAKGLFGPALESWGIKIIFATPGLVLATMFVTLPFVARELIPVMQAQGAEEELAAITLGASGWQMFWRVTLPNIKWGVLYGVVLCNARAMGEFGAVYVVSSHIAGETETMPLRVEGLFLDRDMPGTFAVASVLTLLALITLGVKTVLEHRTAQDLSENAPTAE